MSDPVLPELRTLLSNFHSVDVQLLQVEESNFTMLKLKHGGKKTHTQIDWFSRQ